MERCGSGAARHILTGLRLDADVDGRPGRVLAGLAGHDREVRVWDRATATPLPSPRLAGLLSHLAGPQVRRQSVTHLFRDPSLWSLYFRNFQLTLEPVPVLRLCACCVGGQSPIALGDNRSFTGMPI
jgi:hypothetical protein